jgi:hypothetical protein
VANESTTVWVCTECGREHVKHAPPCSRCGNATLERREQTVDDSELVAPGYRDLVTPRYVLGVGVALALGLVLLLGVAGVIDLPGMNSGVPEVENVPGNADTYEGIDLAAVESAYIDGFNQELDARGGQTLARNDRIDDVAQFYNQRWVTSTVADGDLPPDDQVVDLLDGPCDRPILLPSRQGVPDSMDSADAFGRDLASDQFGGDNATLPQDATVTGVDVHVVEDTVYVTQFVC